MKIKLLEIVKYGFFVMGLFGNALAADDRQDGALLVVGCRPWDLNIQTVELPPNTYFVDSMRNAMMDAGSRPCRLSEAGGEQRAAQHPSFHHLDFNDQGKNGAGKFKEFSEANHQRFGTIIIDLATYLYVEDAAWHSFSDILVAGGSLIVPVTDIQKANSCIDPAKNQIVVPEEYSAQNKSLSKEEAERIIKEYKLAGLFSHVHTYRYEEMSEGMPFDFLRRDPSRFYALPSVSEVIIATK